MPPPLLSKPCRICGRPVTRKRRKTRQAWYYPRQCRACAHRPRDPVARIARLRRSIAQHGQHHTKPLGSLRLHQADTTHTYWLVKVAPHRWQYQHRYLMEQSIGRRLLAHEHVHHLDHNTLNNTMGNLVILSSSAHAKEHLHPYWQESLGPRWSMHYAACIDCGTTTKPHASHGRCRRCRSRHERHPPP